MLKSVAVASAALFISTAAFAQSTVIVTEPQPAPGAVVVHEMPTQVRTYVMQQSVPSVNYNGDVLVGRVLPQDVQVRTVDGYDDYGYTVVNERRVIVEPSTRRVIQVLD